jgi:Probable cobalt transporter subunit (CbtB)
MAVRESDPRPPPALPSGTHDPEEAPLTQPAAVPAPAPTPIPLRDLLPWAAYAAVLALVLLYFVGAEEGATSLVSGSFVHEFVHDGRHLLGFPCH